jgi:phosphate starvation-inducible protein PhoH and related proteins
LSHREKQVLEFRDNDEAMAIMGKFDCHINLLEDSFQVTVIPQGNRLLLEGPQASVQGVVVMLDELLKIYRKGHRLTSQEFEYALSLTREGRQGSLSEIFDDLVYVTGRGKKVKPRTLGQKKYVQAIRDHDIVMGIGPAGTGKTYLAMAMALAALKDKAIHRLILTRPAVEAGEHLGFLPGDMQEKVDPYLRPLYDALYDLLGVETFQKYMEKGIIEVAPLAFMRGRTLDDSFVILDEAQNTTSEQMKMFLTRLGFGSRAVITGDITQVDLPRGKFSGLNEVREILKDIEGICFCYLTDRDVVRHPLVQKIIRAYDLYQKQNN